MHVYYGIGKLGMRRLVRKAERVETLRKAISAVFRINKECGIASDEMMRAELRKLAISALSGAEGCPLSPTEGEIVLRMSDSRLNPLRNAVIQTFWFQHPKTIERLGIYFLRHATTGILRKENLSVSDDDLMKVLAELCDSTRDDKWTLKDHLKQRIAFPNFAGCSNPVQAKVGDSSASTGKRKADHCPGCTCEIQAKKTDISCNIEEKSVNHQP